MLNLKRSIVLTPANHTRKRQQTILIRFGGSTKTETVTIALDSMALLCCARTNNCLAAGDTLEFLSPTTHQRHKPSTRNNPLIPKTTDSTIH
jgi:hypothetical protein